MPAMQQPQFHHPSTHKLPASPANICTQHTSPAAIHPGTYLIPILAYPTLSTVITFHRRKIKYEDIGVKGDGQAGVMVDGKARQIMIGSSLI